jgi:hypothetical protein
MVPIDGYPPWYAGKPHGQWIRVVTMPLNIWCYVSESLLQPEDEAGAIHDIVSVSRLKNAACDVSGALIFTRARFAQFIEGPPQDIATLRQTIQADHRHTKVTTLREGDADSRRFAAWSLAYAGPATFVSRAIERPLIDAIHGHEGSVDALIRLISELARASPQ